MEQMSLSEADQPEHRFGANQHYCAWSRTCACAAVTGASRHWMSRARDEPETDRKTGCACWLT